MAETVRLTAVVTGRVQGVGFRDWVRSRSASLRLSGAAVNLPDGGVEIVVEGSRDACDDLLDALFSGTAPGRVHGVEVTWSAATGGVSDFRVG